MVQLDIIIVNWNAGKQLYECLRSIESIRRDGFGLNRIVVVDNASKDDSLAGINTLNIPIIIIRNQENKGFAFACNQGAKGSEADYLLFLNPDTRLFEDSLIKPLVFMEQTNNWRVAIVGIQLEDENGNVAQTCARFPAPLRFFTKMTGIDRLFPGYVHSHFMVEWDHNETRIVDHVIGAFLLVRRLVFEELGRFDERFFVYLEDLDFSYRAHLAGWKSVYLATAQLYHKGGGTSDQIKATRLFYSLRGRIQYAYKHFGWFFATLLMVGTLFLEPFCRLVLAMWRRSPAEAKETIKGIGMLWLAIPKIVRNVWGSSK